MIDSATFLMMMKNFSSDSSRFDFVKQQYKLIDGLNKDFIIQMARLFGDSYKMDLIKFFKNFLNAKDVPDLVRITKSDSYKMDVIKIFASSYGSSGMQKYEISTIICLLSSDSYKKDAVSFFKNWYDGNDVATLTTYFGSDSYKMDVIKIFAANYGVCNQAEIVKIIKCLKGDSYRNDAIKFFKGWFSSITSSTLILLCSLFEKDSYKLDTLGMYNLSNCFNDSNLLSEILSKFETERNKIKMLEKKITDGITLEKNMINVLSLFTENKYKKKVVALLFSSDKLMTKTFDVDCCSSVMEMFEKPSRYFILCEYMKTHQSIFFDDSMNKLLKQLESKANAHKFLSDHNIVDINKKLVDAGYAADSSNESKGSNVDEDDESASESEPEVEIDNDEESDDEINLDSMDGFGDVKYDRKTGQVTWNGCVMSCGSITINGVDVVKEAKKKAKKEEEKRKEQKRLAQEKKNQLKVPHKWKDVKSTDETKPDDICAVCMSRQRMISLSCGHYCLCGHCTRVILRSGKKQCPKCRQEIKSVTRIFA